MTRNMIRTGAGVLGLLLLVSLPASSQSSRRSRGKAPKLEETLKWLRGLDIAKPDHERFMKFTVEDLKNATEIRIAGHRMSDGKHVQVGGTQMRYLTALPKLEKIDFAENEGIDDVGLKYIGQIKTLKELNLADGNVSSAGLKHLSGLANLRLLNLGWTKGVDDQGMVYLTRLKNLETLSVSATKVTDRGLAVLAKLPRLKTLQLWGLPITDRSLMSLRGLRTVTLIEIGKRKGKVTPKGIAMFRKALPNCRVEYTKPH